MKTNFLIFKNKEDLIANCAHILTGVMQKVLKNKSYCSICLAGGQTPSALYSDLANESTTQIPFSKIVASFGDERCVDPQNQDSNYKMAKNSFGPKFNDFLKVNRLPADNNDQQQALDQATQFFIEPQDIMLLGMGDDAHTASLFPGFSKYQVKNSPVWFTNGPKPPHNRMTIAPSVILSSLQLFILVTGKEKAQALKWVFSEEINYDKYPAQLALGGTWLVDCEAASLLCNF